MTHAILTPTRAAALAHLKQFTASRRAGRLYERGRNDDLGQGKHTQVSSLSPAIRHRLILETEAITETLLHESPLDAEKFIQEICWRTYWKGWLEQRPWIWQQYCEERDAVAQANPATRRALAQAIQGRTGIECFDSWVNELIETGYLHNHARMWFASIWIFTLHLPWSAGADFFMQHLCDADAASNTLSWRWVAGLHTPGKHYLARAENIAKYTNGRFNPKKQLNETALPLVTPSDTKQPGTTALFKGTSVFNASTVEPNSVLLVHDEDLFAESFKQFTQIGAVVIINSATERSTQGLGEVAATFTRDALSDAKQRAIANWSLDLSQVFECAQPIALAGMIQGHRTLGGKPLVTPWVCAGPTRDSLASSLEQLQKNGQAVRYLVRQWDAMAWPHASKGFFQFKTQIPQLLRASLSV